ncbi:hypothetical protein N9164_14765 [Draconibacterium sp.]|nr:hypothetical protein [Draconibacterium sp.]
MKFKIGQKVLCNNASYNNYCACPLVKGEIYTVYGFYTCLCSSEQIYLDEIPDIVFMGCKCHRFSERRHSYYSWRFRPLQYYDIYSELFENKREFGEEVDILELLPERIKTTKTL